MSDDDELLAELLAELRGMAATVDPPPSDAGARWYALDVLARLPTEDLLAVVDVVAQAKLLGDAWLQRQADGRLRGRDTTAVKIEERAPSSPPPSSAPPAPGG